MIGLLLALYPAQWRRRYGEEFRAVLESRPLGPFDVADILLGALDARSRVIGFVGSPRNDGGRNTMLRIGGIGAIVGGIAFVTGFVGGSLNSGGDSAVWFALLAVGDLGILLALIGLSAFQAHRDPQLVWAAFLVPATGSFMSLVGLYGLATQPSDVPMLLGASPWGLMFLGILGTIVGCILFGLATVRAAVLSRRASIALTASSLAVLMVALLSLGVTLVDAAPAIVALALGAFGASWAWLGFSALRRGPIRAVAPA